MPIPSNKAELQAAMASTYQKMRADLADIHPSDATLMELPGHAKGSSMSVCNLVAYLIGWGKLVLKWHRLSEAGEPVDFPETGYKWTELGPLAQRFYADYQHLNYPALLALLDDTVQELEALVANSSNAQLYESPWYGRHTFGRMIQLNTASPWKNARGRVRSWKKSRA